MESINTMDLWAQEISNSDIVPEKYQEKIKEIANSNNTEPYIIFIPEDIQSKHSESMITLYDDSLYIIEIKDNKVVSVHIEFADINLLELSIILLSSHIRINDGFVDKTIYFNTAREDIFHKIVDKIRFKQSSKLDKNTNIEKLNYLKNINLKLYNYSKVALCHHELIIDSVYQATNSDFSYASSITILTDNELVYIEETDENKKPKKSLYGGKWTYISLNKIINASTQKYESNHHFSMILKFKDKNKYEIIYSLDTMSAFKSFDKKIPVSIE